MPASARAKKRRRTHGTGQIYLRGRIWWIAYYEGGRKVRESSESEKREDASALLRKRLAARDVAKVAPSPLIALSRLEQLVANDYAANERRGAGRLAGIWRRIYSVLPPETPTKEITPERILAYVAARRGAEAAAATINRELGQLRRGFRLAVRLGLLPGRPDFSLLQEAAPRQGFLESEHLAAILKALPEHIRPVVEVAHETGWRVYSEVLTREWRHVDLGDPGWLRLEPGTGKTGEGRQFPLTQRLRAILEAQRAATQALERSLARRIATVFPRPDGAVIADGELRHAWEKARVSAGRPGALLHDFRRTAARNLSRAGVPRETAMRMIGHKTESMYRRYAIVDEARLLDAAQQLDEATVPIAVPNSRSKGAKGRKPSRG